VLLWRLTCTLLFVAISAETHDAGAPCAPRGRTGNTSECWEGGRDNDERRKGEFDGVPPLTVETRIFDRYLLRSKLSVGAFGL
jgi:hypothetical protein